MLFCGDFNILEPNHYPHYPTFQDWEYEFYNSLSKFDLVDAYKEKYKNKQAHSWFDRQGSGFRFDHSFISQDICNLLDDCYYMDEPRIQKLSDHSAIITVLNIND